MRILVLGGYGNFGARICRALAADPALEVIAAGRNPESVVPAPAPGVVRAVSLDIAAPGLEDALRAVGAGMVIHCVGPFQGQDYRVARAALAAGAHYIDLADGRDFVAGFATTLDDAARRAGRLAVSGASTLPALSSAVVDALLARFTRLDAISTVIAPAQRAPRGPATLAGVMSYAGRPFRALSNGVWVTRHGWLDLRSIDLGALGMRLSAVCDVPDLALLPARYAGVTTVEFRAALEVGVQHRAIALLARARRLGVQIPVERFAATLDRAAGVFDIAGSELGGMQVAMRGVDRHGAERTLIWRIQAPHNHGPEIPCMAAILLARGLAHGAVDAIGAHACMGFVPLDAFAPEFARWGMTTEVVEVHP